MQWLHTHHYHVMSLAKIVEALRHKQILPDHTVGISFDDAYRSVYVNAWPIIKKYHYPFTVFVATEPVRRHFGDMMRWRQLAQLIAHGADIGNHTVSHQHLTGLSGAELFKEIIQAQAEIEKSLNVRPVLLAYPFGEYDDYVKNRVHTLGFKAAFAQISGAVSEYSDLYALPRFPLNEHYSNIKRFAHVLNMQALNVTALEPQDTVLKQNPPKISFSIIQRTLRTGTFHCYANNGGVVKAELNKWPHVVLHLNKAFPKGRGRINCTAKDKKEQWHWLGFIFLNR
jgi:peptidoglycan/xylan/chitin deacetylase (PgdA/CDA1 family)